MVKSVLKGLVFCVSVGRFAVKFVINGFDLAVGFMVMSVLNGFDLASITKSRYPPSKKVALPEHFSLPRRFFRGSNFFAPVESLTVSRKPYG